jgi:hypothetical protein
LIAWIVAVASVAVSTAVATAVTVSIATATLLRWEYREGVQSVAINGSGASARVSHFEDDAVAAGVE